ncbi:sigma-E factor negative regulatory protein [Parahaliea maris]|uniref:Sigma-E factor negative regulatory protein n=1 Tax=Parahaliea maris TaxID=2716870 RepID=A0A5C9A413_9GAMM|nr:sigma-E factor negative regulatory protein [Parahaliea maris]TXS95508.1 sigma-E factor negative regulatory protein [Parahaliea maris]
MSDRMRESLSALMDGEADELELERVLRQIGEDSELRETWVRYHAVQTVHSGQAFPDLTIDISARVRDELNSVPAANQRRWQSLLRPVAGFAVAASVATTVVLGGQQLAGLDPAAAGSESSVAAGVSPVGLVNSLGATSVRASYGTQAPPVLQPATRTAYSELARQRLQRFAQEHAEQAALNTPQGMLPFARVERITE